MGKFLILVGQMLHRLSLWSRQNPQNGPVWQFAGHMITDFYFLFFHQMLFAMHVILHKTKDQIYNKNLILI